LPAIDEAERGAIRRSGGTGPSAGVVAAVCAAEILGMSGYS